VNPVAALGAGAADRLPRADRAGAALQPPSDVQWLRVAFTPFPVLSF
jgi:hypothetical protein